MGSRSDDGSGWPPDGGPPDGLPDLPEEWGVIVVPDDLRELADEVAAVRAELRRDVQRERRRTAHPVVRGLRRAAAVGARAPVLVVALAVVVTVASLLASAWSAPARTPATPRAAPSTAGGAPVPAGRPLPALELVGTDGRPVPLRARLPVVLLLVDGCACARLINDTVAAVRPDVAVLTVESGPGEDGRVPTTGAAPPPGRTVRALRDPTGELRKGLHLPEPDGRDTAAAVLVDRGGDIVRTVPHTATVDDLGSDLSRL